MEGIVNFVWEKRKKRWLLFGILLSLFLFGLQELRVFDLADAYWLKSCFKLRQILQLERAKDSPIVLVPVTSQSIEKIGRWPWERSVWGTVTRKLELGGARVIGYDIDFSTPAPGDDIFAKSLQRNVVLPLWFEYVENGKVSVQTPPIRAGFPSPPLLQKSKQGFVNIQTGTLGTRRVLPLVRYNGENFPSFALKIYSLYKQIPLSSIFLNGRKLQVSDKIFNLDRDGSLWINYRTSNFETVPADAILDPNFPEKDVFKGKIVLVGVTSPIGQDIKITPAGSMSGLEIQAQIVRDMLFQEFLAPFNPYLELLFLLILGSASMLILPSYSWKRYLPWVCFSIIMLPVASFVLFVGSGVVFDVFTPTLLLLVAAAIVTLSESHRSETSLSSKIEELKVMSQVSKLQTGNISLDDLLGSALEMIQEVIGVNTLGILLADDQNRLILNVARGASYEAHERILNEKEGICGQVASTGHPFHTENLENIPFAAKFEKKLEVNSFMAVPLVSKNRTVGVLWVGSMDPNFNRETLIRLSTMSNQLAISVENCLMTRKLGQLYLDAVRSLVRAVEYYYPSSRGHTERVASYALMMAKGCDLSLNEMETVRSAALLHDIGRMGQFETLYRKPDGLTEEDWKQIITPLKSGLKILEPLGGEYPIIPVLYHFYERYDGKGFPDGLKGDKIPIGSRILAVANAFDDISVNGPQLGEVSIERAIQELRKESGTLFDPTIVRLLINAISHIPAEEWRRGYFLLSPSTR